MKTLSLSALLLCATSAWGAYPYYLTDPLTSINSTKWSSTGSLAPGSTGLAAPDANGGTLISRVPIPDDTSEAEVAITVKLAQSGGSYTAFVQASADAHTGPSSAGTFFAFEMQNPTFDSTGKICTANFAVFQGATGTISLISVFQHSCRSGMLMRLAIHGTTAAVYPDQAEPMEFTVAPAGSGQPGIGTYATPAGNAISLVQLGAIDRTPPPAIDSSKLQMSVFREHIDLQWPTVSKAASSAAIAGYWVYRNGDYLLRTAMPGFSDEAIQPGGQYTYAILAADEHYNFSAAVTVTASVPVPKLVPVAGMLPTAKAAIETTSRPGGTSRAQVVSAGQPQADSGGGLDPRRVGVRALGSYWGTSGEAIDTASGNLNFSIPLLTAQAANGWGVSFVLSYNSQIWRQDPSTNWLLGLDTGYGLGWTLQAGAIIPVWAGSTIDHYIFVDSTGAEYSLDQNPNHNNVWTSQEGIYMTYVAGTNTLYFTDGTFWTMGCQSASGEPDSGSLYPTTFEDSNGNMIIAHYLTGSGSSLPDTSARIYYIEDQRGLYGIPSQHSSFLFSYDGTNHLSSIAGGAGYSFSFQTSGLLISPFNSNYTFPAEYLLTTATLTENSNVHRFTYAGGSAEMTGWTSPFGGTLSWVYRSFTYAGNISLREVLSRSMQSVPWNSSYSAFNLTNTWTFSHLDAYDATLQCHYYSQLYDQGANSYKLWVFNLAAPAIADPNQYWEYTAQVDPLLQKAYSWTQNNGNTYINSVSTTLNAGFSYAATTTTSQTRDAYGNLTQQLIYDYGNPSTPAWTYNLTYLIDSNHVSRYIRNRLTAATVTTASGALTLAMIGYDTTSCLDNTYSYLFSPGTPPYIAPVLHDANYGSSFVYRGNPAWSNNLAGTTCSAHNINGTVYYAMDGSGRHVTSSTSAATNYSLPSAITPNDNSNLTSSFGYSGAFLPQSFTGPNGDVSTTMTDQVTGLPWQSTLADGATIYYTYAYYQNGNSQSVNTQTATLGNQWKTTTLDGFGRVIRAATGYTISGNPTTVNTVDSQYAACACSPLGKLKQTSLPYAPGGTPVWTVYTYDASGRTLTAVKPDNQSTTNYAYQGNNTTVTDPAGKWKTFTSDAAGNLIRVTEPDPLNDGFGNYVTNYTYTGANQLTGVSMNRPTGLQTRSFTWSGAYLVSSTNPENGTVTYQYDGAGRITQRLDAKNQKTTYTYDTYGRLTEVQHFVGSGSPPYYQYTEDLTQQVNYHYDYNSNPINGGFTHNGWGRLTGVTFQNESILREPLAYYYSYNQAGKVIDQQLQLWFNGNNGWPLFLDALYAWDNQGRMTSLTYPSTSLPAMAFQYQYDNAGRLATLQQTTCAWEGNGACGQWGGSTTAVSATYSAAGQITSMTYDMFTETRTYNNLLQLTRETASGTVYNQWVTAKDMQYTYSGNANNGRILSSTDNVSGETVNYTYDALNRLIGAQATAGGWSETYSYDGFGNLGSGYSPSTNRTNTQSADANGNSTAYGYTWDIENRLVSAAANMYWAYDPHGKRILTENLGTQSNNFTTTGELDFYGISGKKLAAFGFQYDSNGTFSLEPWTNTTNVYFGGKLIRSNGNTVVTDRLGSVRDTAHVSSNEVMRYTPYGTERTSTADGREKWGTYLRDMGTGLDYADQRYKGVGMGAFLSPDPGGIATAKPRDPGSWNRYAYTRGDPINHTDRHGTNVDDDPDDGGCWWDEDNEILHCSVTGTGGGGGGYGGGGSGGGGQTCEENPFQAQCESPDPGPGPDPNPDPDPDPDPRRPCTTNQQTFINTHLKDASAAASLIGTSAVDILALSAYESGWGLGPFVAAQGTYTGNAFFNLEGEIATPSSTLPATLYNSTGWSQPSTQKNSDGKYAVVAGYASYYDAAMSFVNSKGGLLANVTDETVFGEIVATHGFGITVSIFVSIANTIANCLH